MVWYGLGIIARHRLIGALVFVSGLRHSLFLATEVVFPLVNFGYTVLVHRPRFRFVLASVFISSTLLFAAMLY
jgi:hypothetical protein